MAESEASAWVVRVLQDHVGENNVNPASKENPIKNHREGTALYDIARAQNLLKLDISSTDFLFLGWGSSAG